MECGQWELHGAVRISGTIISSAEIKNISEHKSYPIMKEAAEFCMNWLVVNPKTGYLVSGPSISPENSFKIPGGGGNASMVMGPTMDHMIIRDLITKYYSGQHNSR